MMMQQFSQTYRPFAAKAARTLVTALILLLGLGAESLAWLIVFLFAPISAIYYPVDVLPTALQWLALPPLTVHDQPPFR